MQLPKLSLANNPWIGDIPWQLRVLSFAKQLLILHLYCHIYVFKLFPKGLMTGADSTFQRGMQGTMSTYDLDMSGISIMVARDMMPRLLTILPSLISVTFIGHGKLPKGWM